MTAEKIILTVHMLGQGGTDRVCTHLANGLAAAGFDTEVLAFCRGGGGEEALTDILDQRVRLTSLSRRSLSRPLDLVSRLPGYVRHLNRTRPQCVISTGNNMSWVTALGLRASSLADCALIMKTTNPIVRPTDWWLKRTIRTAGYRRAFSAADAIWALSQAETEQLRSVFPNVAARFQTVINPYVTPAMVCRRSRRWLDDKAPLVLAVGRLSNQKRLERLIRAFALVRNADARLAILGDGPEREALEELVAQLGLEDRVIMPGYVSDIERWYARARLFVLSSVYEGLPAVVLEAMAADCPVLTTDCFPLARELASAGDGCSIIESADPPELAAMIDASLSRARPNGLRELAETYSIESGIASHVSALCRLISRDTGPRNRRAWRDLQEIDSCPPRIAARSSMWGFTRRPQTGFRTASIPSSMDTGTSIEGWSGPPFWRGRRWRLMPQ
jgi:glycosyltransferase involved in cell wall biosynthesis